MSSSSAKVTRPGPRGNDLPADLVAADLNAVTDALGALLAAWEQAGPAVATIRHLLADIAADEVLRWVEP